MALHWDLGSGLVEIAALTALIGAITAEVLVLIEVGAAGMPWAAMSSFGIASLSRCVSQRPLLAGFGIPWVCEPK